MILYENAKQYRETEWTFFLYLSLAHYSCFQSTVIWLMIFGQNYAQ